MADKKSRSKKGAIKVHDLPPRKDAVGGEGLHSRNPPLPIPPPGFITPSSANGKSQ